MPDEIETLISINQIRNELNLLWASQSSGDAPVIRAQTHNLIVYCADNVSAQKTTEQVIALTAERPGRVIIIDIENGRTKPPDALVSTYCRAVKSQQVCGEVITLTTSAARKLELYSSVLSLLCPDLPVYVWWLDSPSAQDQLFERLTNECDRLIVDSGNFADLHEVFGVVDKTVGERKLGDLNWARLTIWRQQLATLWDRPRLKSYLAVPRQIDISMVGPSGTNPAAAGLLVAGWLAASLSWNVLTAKQVGSRLHLECQTTSQDAFEIILHVLENQDALSNLVTGITLEFGPLDQPLKVSVQRHEESNVIKVEIAEPGSSLVTCSQVYSRRSDAILLIDELDIGFDAEYDRALAEVLKAITLVIN